MNATKTALQNTPSQQLNIIPGRPSPLASPSLGEVVIRLLLQTEQESDYTTVQTAIKIALEQGPTFQHHNHSMGGDEILYGRAGLLWSLLRLYDQNLSDQFSTLLKDSIPKITDAIIDAGKYSSKKHIEVNGQEDSMPLMWSWLDNYSSLGL